jgi:DNA-binding CsgD family transcriptional regulator
MSVLTDRERDVFEALARGRTTEEVAAELHLSPHTVRTYVRSAMRKLGSRTRAQGVAIAMNRGLISALDLEPVERETPSLG